MSMYSVEFFKFNTKTWEFIYFPQKLNMLIFTCCIHERVYKKM